MKRILVACAVVSAAVFTACFIDNGAVTYATPFDGGPLASAAGGVGAKCDDANICRPGLACTSGTCAPGHSLDDGTACVINDECKAGSYCGPNRKCAPAGAGAAGDSCHSDGDCTTGLRCDIVGLSAECQPEGMSDVGGMCKTSADCFGGLACAAGVCAPNPPSATSSPLAIPGFMGVACMDDTSKGPKAYFRVPRGTPDDGDFFRLPYPSDVRLKAGHPNLASFPTPGSDILGFDVVDRYARYVETQTDGWSTYSTIIMRFNQEPNLDTLSPMGALQMVDLTANAQIGFAWSATTGRSAYVCANSISARPVTGAPFAPGHTYAFIMTNVVKTKDGTPFVIDDDLKALLGSTAAAAPLDAAYASYKPLRDWAAMANFDLSKVLNVAVFTTAHATSIAANLQKAVAAAAAPTATNWIKCDGASKSPCPQADGDRACPASPDPNFDELQALVTLPIFQKGTAPYLTPTDGGDVELDANGVPKLQRTESVCMSLTVPKSPSGADAGSGMPAGGWPVVIFAHGTGGSYRDAITQGVSASLTPIAGVAVLGIDQVEHGPRRGASTESPNNLFFNFANPSAARGNALQGAADQMSLARFVTGFTLPANTIASITTDIKLGTAMFWGHSQGATEGGIAMPYTPGISGVVFSGQGASLIHALLNKRSPVDIADVIPAVLEDPTVNEAHPVLSLLQNAIDPADPLNHASSLIAQPIMGGTAKNVFQVYGEKDTYAPPITEDTYAVAAALGVIAPPQSVAAADVIGDGTTNPAPFGGNFPTNLTGVVRQYSPQLYDGHFVAFKDPDAIKDVAHFFQDIGNATSPVMVAR